MKKKQCGFFIFFAILFFLTASYKSPQYDSSKVIPPVPLPLLKKQTGIQITPPLLKVAAKPLIIVDPGHGGRDLGTFSLQTPKYQEKFMTLSTARILKNYLEQMGFSVFMTRTEDIFVSLEQRAAMANGRNPRLFVSLHYNSAANKLAEGIEIFYYRSVENKGRTNQSKALAQVVLKHMLKTTEAKSRGVKHGNLSVIRETNMPAILIEGGFMTNENEIQKIKDPIYLKKIAWGIAQGIQEFLNS